jgi:hypothetical protein
MPTETARKKSKTEWLWIGAAILGIALLYVLFKRKTTSTIGTAGHQYGQTPGGVIPTPGGFSPVNLTSALQGNPLPTPATSTTSPGVSTTIPTGSTGSVTGTGTTGPTTTGGTAPPVAKKPTKANPRANESEPGGTSTRIGLPIVGITGGALPPAGQSVTGPSVATVYNALIAKGLKPFQAAGIMGNIQNESSFRVEVAAPDSGGTTSYGLIQWNSGGLGAGGVGPGLVTGNPKKDFNNQINAIATLFKTHNISGSTAGEVAGQWASKIEGCVGCQPGGSQWSQRVANAEAIFAQAAKGGFTSKTKSIAAHSTVTNNFPGGYANWVKWFTAHPNATTYGGPGAPGTPKIPLITPAELKGLQNLAKLNTHTRAGAAKPKARPKPTVHKAVLVSYHVPARRPAPARRAAPKRGVPASKPRVIRGAIRKQYFR